MVFTKKLRPGIRSGDITTSIRIWKYPRVKAGASYPMDEGRVVVTSIREIGFDDLSESLAVESGFSCLADLLKTAQHGSGSNIYFIRFYYTEGDA